MNIQEVSIEKIKPYERNPRKNDEAVKYVAQSIQEFGFKVPIIIDSNNVIVTGHTRYKAALELGLKKVPCIVADDLTEEQIKAFRLVDNKVAEKSEWIDDLLTDELSDILNIDMSIYDFDIDRFEEEINNGELVETNNFNYKEQYGVIVICKDEAEQEQIYNELHEKGYSCKVVAT